MDQEPATTTPDEKPIEPRDALIESLEAGDAARAFEILDALTAGDLARTISLISPEEHEKVFRLIKPDDAAELIDELSETQAAALIEELEPDHAAGIVAEMDSDMQADVLGAMDAADADAILDELEPEEAEGIRTLMSYPPDTAGGIMVTEFVAFAANKRISRLLDDLRKHGERYSDFDVQYVYVVDRKRRLTGVLRMRDMLFLREDATAGEVMLGNPISVRAETTLNELNELFDDRPFLGIPVVDAEDRLVGIVRRSSVREAVEKRASRLYLKVSGIIGGEELRNLSLFTRSTRRLSWLSLNIVLNIVAASVIAVYQDTLQQIIALAVFLPIISDMSGCSGNQAVAVSMRELTLGIVKPRDHFRVLMKEAPLGIVNGLVLGLLLGIAGGLWQRNAFFGLVVGGALAANTLVSVSMGGLVPLALRRLKLDPALVSGPILTTVTDMCGFFFVLSFASMALSHLV